MVVVILFIGVSVHVFQSWAERNEEKRKRQELREKRYLRDQAADKPATEPDLPAEAPE